MNEGSFSLAGPPFLCKCRSLARKNDFPRVHETILSSIPKTTIDAVLLCMLAIISHQHSFGIIKISEKTPSIGKNPLQA
jgi:hypothetical protein